MNAKNDDHTISLHLLPTTSLENVNHINFGVSKWAKGKVKKKKHKKRLTNVSFGLTYIHTP